MVLYHQALKIDQFKTNLPTFRLPNTNVHHVLRIDPRNESRHSTKKMTAPTKQSTLRRLPMDCFASLAMTTLFYAGRRTTRSRDEPATARKARLASSSG